MAKKKGGNSNAAFAWRLLLIPFAFVYYKLLGLFDIHSLEFVSRFMDALGVSDYTLNFIVLILAAVGLVLLIVNPSSKRIWLGVGVILFLLPVWYRGSETVGDIGAKAFKTFEFDLEELVFCAGAALWATVVVRSDRSWISALVAACLIAENVFLCVMNDPPIDWMTLTSIMSLALLSGWAIDWVNHTPSVQSVLPAALVLFEALALGYMERQTVMYITIALGLVGMIYLFIGAAKGKRSLGGAAAMLGIAVNAGSLLYIHGMIF